MALNGYFCLYRCEFIKKIVLIKNVCIILLLFKFIYTKSIFNGTV